MSDVRRVQQFFLKSSLFDFIHDKFRECSGKGKINHTDALNGTDGVNNMLLFEYDTMDKKMRWARIVAAREKRLMSCIQKQFEEMVSSAPALQVGKKGFGYCTIRLGKRLVDREGRY